MGVGDARERAAEALRDAAAGSRRLTKRWSKVPREEPGSQMRAGDADRERVAEVLREAAATGRITLDELDERLTAVFAARTYGDLEPLTADLPESTAAGAEPAVPAARGREPLELKATAGTLTRKGTWDAPAQISVANPMGSTLLDFRSARLAAATTSIDIGASWGEVRVVLPEGASAEIAVDSSWFGSVDSRVPDRPAPPAPHFIIRGTAKGGSVQVRYASRIQQMLGFSG
ncbi:DUF1707 SHOCT-like domain-containing protein [Nocardiopsis coralliicola]